MPTHIPRPTRVVAAGTPPKFIDEYIGRTNSNTEGISIAHMRSPAGWSEPRQQPEFTEYTVVLRGLLRVQHDGGEIDVHAGQTIVTHPGERVRYGSPLADGAEYIAVCVPAFSPQTVHRDQDDN